MYAVIDLETTGLFPGRHDRVVEVAVVHVDGDGRQVDEWCTLVNPQRDLGPQDVHGIRAAEVLDAPTFADVAAHLSTLLAGRVVVAHNLRFDAPFLGAEYARLGVQMPVGVDDGLCTMTLASDYLPAPGRSLVDCCEQAGVQITHAHSALHDARAAAGLLAHYLRSAGQPPPWADRCAAAAGTVWPALSGDPVRPVTRQSADSAAGSGGGPDGGHFLSRLVARLPRATSADADSYLDLLDKALLDRRISATEERDLVQFAHSVGLSREQVTELHEQYLQALATLAREDGVVTAAERADLEQVATLLGLETGHLDKVLSDSPADVTGWWGQFTLRPGDAVVFTGQFDESRELWEERAAAAGLEPRPSVTKRTRLVVAADPDSLSGKARKARDYRIPIVTPAKFRQLTTQMPDGH